MCRRVLAAVVVLLSLAGPASAQLDAEAKTPCLWRVVLKAQHHPLLSPAFREQIRRDITAALQPALGPLGTVEVVDLAELPRDRWDTLWQEFDDKGFPALDASRDLSGVKTHFLALGYRDGQYQLESRQHDGFSGLASPLVRKQSVRVPEMVGRTAGLMLDRDFGLTGSIEVNSAKQVDDVRVTVRGGQLGSLERFVKVGDVFAVSQVFKTDRPAPPPVRTATGKIIAAPAGSVPPPALTANARQLTLLKVTDVGKDGTLKCAVYSRYQNPVGPGGRTLGYRCMKLGTVEGPLTVRLVTSRPEDQKSTGLATVRATEKGFTAAPEAGDLFVFKDGLFRSGRQLSQVACVTVALSPTRAVQFPIPVLGPEPVNLPFEINPRLEEEAALTRLVLATAARVTDARNAQAICFDATAKLIEKKKNVDALARARGGFQAADAADKSITDDLARLKESPATSAEAQRLIASIENQLLSLRNFNLQLDKHVKTLDAVVKRENDPKIAVKEVQAEAVNARLTVLLGQGELDQAIAAYDELLRLYPDSADFKTRREQLVAEKQPKSDAHGKARRYLLETWSALAAIPDFKDSLPQLTSAIDECVKVGDKFTLRKLLTIFTAAGAKLNDLTNALDPNADADRKLATDARAVVDKLTEQEAKITKVVEGK